MRHKRYPLSPRTPAKPFLIRTFLVVAALAATLFWHPFVLAAEPFSPSGQILLAKYSDIRTRLENNQFGMPLSIESLEESSSLHVDMYGVFAYPFARVRDALQTPENWCDINSLLINIKAATFSRLSEQWLLTLYSGRKYYQPPEDAFKLDLSFHVAAAYKDYLDIELAGEHGPLGTRDHQIRFEAVPLDKDRTFIHFHYEYSFGILARTAMASYYSTIGRSKKGFSKSAIENKGVPEYVHGARGSLERTAVRSYLAIQTYMETLDTPDHQQFEKRINRWYDLTAQFPQQLYEMNKGEYLANKRREHHNQLILQENLAN